MTAKILTLALVVLLPALAEAQHPCDTTPPTSGTAVAGAVPLGWCHDGRDINNNVTAITSWAFYSNTTRITLTNVTTNNVANAAGLKFYQATVTFAAGNFTVTVAAINATGEGQKTPPFALSVSAPSAVPRAPTRFRIS